MTVISLSPVPCLTTLPRWAMRIGLSVAQPRLRCTALPMPTMRHVRAVRGGCSPCRSPLPPPWPNPEPWRCLLPWNRADYPPSWEAFRASLLRRAHNCCEGTPMYPDCRAVNHDAHPDTDSRVVLTTAHLCLCVPKCDEPSHCRVLCQRCHLALDHDRHMQRSAETRRHQKEALGQLSFLA